MGVSYAPPAYYADRLCERGRCYMRKWFNPDRDTKNDWDRKKRNHRLDVKKERDAKNLKANRPERKRGDKKTELELTEEEEDKKEVAKRMMEELKKEINERWVPGPVDGAEIRGAEMLHTMYWM